MKKRNPRGRPRKYPKEDPQAILKISLAKSMKTKVEEKAQADCAGNVSEYVVRALVHYMTCEKVAVAKLHGKEVQLSNGASILAIEPPADFDPQTLFERALIITDSAIACGLLKRYLLGVDRNGYYKLTPEIISQIEREYKDFENLVGTLKAEKRGKAISMVFDIMLSEYERLKVLPEYIEWLGLVYGYMGPSVDESDEE